jgi:hypothetical protein
MNFSAPRRWFRFSLRTLFVLVLIILVVCYRIERSIVLRPSFLAGVYEGNYEGGRETIELQENRTYHQVFVKDGKRLYANSGWWEIRNGEIFLDRFINVFWIRWDDVKDDIPAHGEALIVGLGADELIFFEPVEYLHRKE